jgi:hypothetical protein
MRAKALWSLGIFALAAACVSTTPAKHKTLIEKKMDSLAAMAARGTFVPPPLDGAKLATGDVELLLPRGCAPLDADGMIKTASVVDDAESELLAACNIVAPASPQGVNGQGVKVTWVLIRHNVQVETGETAAAALLRSPAVLAATTTTMPPLPGGTVGPEVVVTLNAPWSADARPSTALWYGALDGLYVLYAEVDADASSIAEWGDALAAAMLPTTASHPIRWRAPTGVAPSKSAFGPWEIKLPEKVSTVSKTFDDVVGDTKDPLDPHDARAFASFRDESGFAFAGAAYVVKLLAPIAGTPAQLARLSADARDVTIEGEETIASSVGDIARVDGPNARGDHEVYAVFSSSNGEATVLHFVVAKSKWAAYAPFLDASLATLARAKTNDPY